jgi:GTP cyclohydrolase I
MSASGGTSVVSNSSTNPFGQETTEEIERAVGTILTLLELTGDHNFDETPERVTKWLVEFSNHKNEKPHDILSPIFPEEHDEMIMVHNIGFTAMCAHHMLPFSGLAHVGYIPCTDFEDKTKHRVVGISKLVRLVEHFSRRFTLQERITRQIIDAMEDVLGPQGTMVVITAEHGCMKCRGVRNATAVTTTSAVRGKFLSNHGGCKDEFLKLMQSQSR